MAFCQTNPIWLTDSAPMTPGLGNSNGRWESNPLTCLVLCIRLLRQVFFVSATPKLWPASMVLYGVRPEPAPAFGTDASTDRPRAQRIKRSLLCPTCRAPTLPERRKRCQFGVQACSCLAASSAASSKAWHSLGRSATSIGLGFAGSIVLLRGLGGALNFLNQSSNSWPQPSSVATGAWGMQAGFPGGQSRRTWK